MSLLDHDTIRFPGFADNFSHLFGLDRAYGTDHFGHHDLSKDTFNLDPPRQEEVRHSGVAIDIPDFVTEDHGVISKVDSSLHGRLPGYAVLTVRRALRYLCDTWNFRTPLPENTKNKFKVCQLNSWTVDSATNQPAAVGVRIPVSHIRHNTALQISSSAHHRAPRLSSLVIQSSRGGVESRHARLSGRCSRPTGAASLADRWHLLRPGKGSMLAGAEVTLGPREAFSNSNRRPRSASRTAIRSAGFAFGRARGWGGTHYMCRPDLPFSESSFP